jgi:hypothetical protein
MKGPGGISTISTRAVDEADQVVEEVAGAVCVLATALEEGSGAVSVPPQLYCPSRRGRPVHHRCPSTHRARRIPRQFYSRGLGETSFFPVPSFGSACHQFRSCFRATTFFVNLLSMSFLFARDVCAFCYNYSHVYSELYPTNCSWMDFREFIVSAITPWRISHQVEDLVQLSAGRSIYASTIITFIDDDNYIPTDRLVAVQDSNGTTSDSRFDPLEQIYPGSISLSCVPVQGCPSRFPSCVLSMELKLYGGSQAKIIAVQYSIAYGNTYRLNHSD